jgi:DNA mismatch repair ATPase MutS
MNEHRELTETLNKLLNESEDKEPVISFLRLSNYSKAQSIKILKEILHIPFLEAQYMVHNSQTWGDVKEFNTELMNDFFDALEKEAKDIKTEEI